MPNDIFCTVCSREKSESPDALPAAQRYIGTHIRHVSALAQVHTRPLYVLSGIYGLLELNDPVGYYDHLLRERDVAKLVKLLKEQLALKEVSSVQFYCKDKPSWSLYKTAMVAACQRSGIIVRTMVLADHL